MVKGGVGDMGGDRFARILPATGWDVEHCATRQQSGGSADL